MCVCTHIRSQPTAGRSYPMRLHISKLPAIYVAERFIATLKLLWLFHLGPFH